MKIINQCGRSMIEMLGVLAIIGVLSVGGIAGYQKAMFKYRLNQYTQSMNIFINNFFVYAKQFEHTNASDYYGEIMFKLNLIPDGMFYNPNNPVNVRITDAFGNYVIPYHDNQGDNHFGIMFPMGNTLDDSTACKAILEIAKQHAEQIWMVYFQGKGDQENGSTNTLWGNKYCSKIHPYPCIRDLTITQKENLCNQFQNQNLNRERQIQIVFK